MKNHRTLVSALFLGSLLASGCVLAPGNGDTETTGEVPEKTSTAHEALSTSDCPTPAVVSVGPNSIHIFDTEGGEIKHAHYLDGVVLTCDQEPNFIECITGNGGGGWEELGEITTTATTGVAAAGWDENDIWVFVRGADGDLQYRQTNGVIWSDWVSLGGQLIATPTATSAAPGTLDVFALGTDDNIWRIHYEDGAWSGWLLLGNSASVL